MYNTKNHEVSLKELNRKLDTEARRIVKEKEENIVKYVSKQAHLGGNSKIFFKNKDGANVTISFRLNKDGNIRLAYEKQFAGI